MFFLKIITILKIWICVSLTKLYSGMSFVENLVESILKYPTYQSKQYYVITRSLYKIQQKIIEKPMNHTFSVLVNILNVLIGRFTKKMFLNKPTTGRVLKT